MSKKVYNAHSTQYIEITDYGLRSSIIIITGIRAYIIIVIMCAVINTKHRKQIYLHLIFSE